MKKLRYLTFLATLAFAKSTFSVAIEETEQPIKTPKILKANVVKGLACLGLAAITIKLWCDFVDSNFLYLQNTPPNDNYVLRDNKLYNLWRKPTTILANIIAKTFDPRKGNDGYDPQARLKISIIASGPLLLAFYILAKNGIKTLRKELKKSNLQQTKNL